MSAVVRETTGGLPTDLAGWLACASDLSARQAVHEAERAHLATRRQLLAMPAAIGDGRAQKKIEHLAARESALDLSIASVAQALERAGTEIAAAQAAATAEATALAVEQHEAKLDARLSLVAEIETRLRAIVPLLAALGERTQAIGDSHRTLGGARTALPSLAAEAVGGRLAEFMAGIGFADWLPLARPEIRPALACWADAEHLAQQSYGVAHLKG